MRFIYEGDDIEIDVISKLTGFTKADIKAKAILVGDGNKLDLDMWTFKVSMKDKPKKKRKIDITKKVKLSKNVDTKNRIFSINGKVQTLKQCAKKIGMGEVWLGVITKGYSSMTINGITIKIKHSPFFKLVKDGVEQRHLTRKQVSDITGLDYKAMYYLIRSKYYHRNGWQIFREAI